MKKFLLVIVAQFLYTAIVIYLSYTYMTNFSFESEGIKSEDFLAYFFNNMKFLFLYSIPVLGSIYYVLSFLVIALTYGLYMSHYLGLKR